MTRRRFGAWDWVNKTQKHNRGYSPPGTGGVDAHQEDGAKPPLKARPGWSVRRKRGRAGLTTPSAPLRLLRVFFLMAQPPLLSQEGNTLASTNREIWLRLRRVVSLCFLLPFNPEFPILKVFLFPDGNDFLQLVDGVVACVEGGAAGRGGDDNGDA